MEMTVRGISKGIVKLMKICIYKPTQNLKMSFILLMTHIDYCTRKWSTNLLRAKLSDGAYAMVKALRISLSWETKCAKSSISRSPAAKQMAKGETRATLILWENLSHNLRAMWPSSLQRAAGSWHALSGGTPSTGVSIALTSDGDRVMQPCPSTYSMRGTREREVLGGVL